MPKRRRPCRSIRPIRAGRPSSCPDSRAIKKLGLGPDYSNAINAKNATFVDPPPVSTIPSEQASGFAQAAGVNR